MFLTKVPCSKHDYSSELTARLLVNWLSRVGILPITPDYENGSSFQNTVFEKTQDDGQYPE